jgi:hypothetical protein
VPSIVGQRRRVALEKPEHGRHRGVGNVLDDGRIVDDHAASIAHFGELPERLQVGMTPGLVNGARCTLAQCAILDVAHDLVSIDARVPNIES